MRRAAAGAFAGDDPSASPRSDQPAREEHDLAVARLWAHLRTDLDALPGAALRRTSERALRARDDHVRDPEARHALPFLPDAYVELDVPGLLVRCFLIEVDRGTLTLERFARKARAFELFLAQRHFARRYGRASFKVVSLGENDERLENLAWVTRAVVAEDRFSAYRSAPVDSLVNGPVGRAVPRTPWRPGSSAPLGGNGDDGDALDVRPCPVAPPAEPTKRGAEGARQRGGGRPLAVNDGRRLCLSSRRASRPRQHAPLGRDGACLRGLMGAEAFSREIVATTRPELRPPRPGTPARGGVPAGVLPPSRTRRPARRRSRLQSGGETPDGERTGCRTSRSLA